MLRRRYYSLSLPEGKEESGRERRKLPAEACTSTGGGSQISWPCRVYSVPSPSNKRERARVRGVLRDRRSIHHIRNNARQLRRNQTDAERVLWMRLRNRQLCGAKFRRQNPIGLLVADFRCPQQQLVVQLDSGQHAAEVVADKKRSRFLEEQGYQVLRFWNHEVLRNLDGVLERISELLSNPHPGPLPGRAREKNATR